MNDLAVKILLCYSDKDRDMVDHLKDHLRPLEYCKLITSWDHSDISPGADRKQEMDKHFDEAQVILLLLSASFLAAEYWYSVVQRSIERYDRKEARVIPVILRDVMWEITPLNKLKPLPDDGESIADWESRGIGMRDKGYKNVAAGIFKAIEEQKALSSLDERKTLKANLDQLIETIMAQILPPYRAEALIYTLQQSWMIIPNDVTLADLVVGWQILSPSSTQGEEPATKLRRDTCDELAKLASQFITSRGNLTQAIKTWRIWRDAFQNSDDPRQSTMGKTFARELTELQEAAATL